MSVFIIEHIYKKYVIDKKDNYVLKDINFKLPDKGFVSIVGKSGCGKSTLLNLMSGIEKPTKGRILFENKNISKFSDKKFSKFHLQGVSLVFQHYNLFNDETCLRNVMIPLLMKGFTRAKAKKKSLELFNKFNLNYLVYRKVKTLSGGEKQRVAILRSLVIDPKVLLCDEPTGALDEKNSKEILEILKEISLRKLVVMVSHNLDLVNEYSDQIISLKNGSIESINGKLKNSFDRNDVKEKCKYSSKWNKKVLLSNILKHFKKNLFSIIACSISISGMFLSIGFINGSKDSQEEALTKNLSLNYATISQTEFIDVENSPIQYQKSVRPALVDVDEVFDDFNSIACEENISYFISNFSSVTYNKKTLNDYSLVPLFDETLEFCGKDLLIEGNSIGENFEEIIINSEFKKLLNIEDACGQEIIISSDCPISYATNDNNFPFVKDNFSYSKKFLIKGVVKEFPFLNTPKIYFSYYGARNFLKTQIMVNLSNYFGRTITFFNYLETSENNNPVNSYSYFIFVKDKGELNKFFNRIKKLSDEENSIQVTSNSFQIKETYTTFINSFSTSLIVFLVLTFLGMNLILGMISFSTFIENKKNAAILTCLGARNKSLRSLYLGENCVVLSASFIGAIPLSIFLQNKLNILISEKFFLNNLINIPFSALFGIPFLLIFLTYTIAIIFMAIFTLTPMMVYRKFSLADELRDE